MPVTQQAGYAEKLDWGYCEKQSRRKHFIADRELDLAEAYRNSDSHVLDGECEVVISVYNLNYEEQQRKLLIK